MKFAHSRLQVCGAKIGPHPLGKHKFGVGALPQQEVAQSLLSAGSDQQIDFRDRAGLAVGFAEGEGECITVKRRGRLKQVRGSNDRVASGIIDRDSEVQMISARRMSFGCADSVDQGGVESITPSNDLEFDAPLTTFFGFSEEVLSEELHEGGNFSLGPLPVVGGEGIECKDTDAELGCRFDCPAYCLASRFVPGYPCESSGISPATVPVHDDPYM